MALERWNVKTPDNETARYFFDMCVLFQATGLPAAFCNVLY